MKLEQLKSATKKYFRNGGWTESDLAIVDQEADNIDDLVYVVIYHFAALIGRRKGYGDEGISELHGEYVDAIFKDVGETYNWDE